MGLNYSAGCVNFRDVGVALELIAGLPLFPTGKLFRGGKINAVTDIATIGHPATILNLRRGLDPQHLRANYAHFSASNDLEKYETSNREVRRWLNNTMSFLSDSATELPVLIHCTSGKDRTGVVVAALLSIIGIERPVIVEEYLLSDGEVNSEWIETALDGFANTDRYFNRVDLQALRKRFDLESSK
ncbi:MAG: tyrosine-protein phosphatase [bacterium]|nr:tyrosine-protein phosphatase [bacterium]